MQTPGLEHRGPGTSAADTCAICRNSLNEPSIDGDAAMTSFAPWRGLLSTPPAARSRFHLDCIQLAKPVRLVPSATRSGSSRTVRLRIGRLAARADNGDVGCFRRHSRAAQFADVSRSPPRRRRSSGHLARCDSQAASPRAARSGDNARWMLGITRFWWTLHLGKNLSGAAMTTLCCAARARVWRCVFVWLRARRPKRWRKKKAPAKPPMKCFAGTRIAIIGGSIHQRKIWAAKTGGDDVTGDPTIVVVADDVDKRGKSTRDARWRSRGSSSRSREARSRTAFAPVAALVAAAAAPRRRRHRSGRGSTTRRKARHRRRRPAPAPASRGSTRRPGRARRRPLLPDLVLGEGARCRSARRRNRPRRQDCLC